MKLCRWVHHTLKLFHKHNNTLFIFGVISPFQISGFIHMLFAFELILAFNLTKIHLQDSQAQGRHHFYAIRCCLLLSKQCDEVCVHGHFVNAQYGLRGLNTLGRFYP